MTGEGAEVDVAIVGFGPTGATLANLLAISGVSVAVIEREAAMYHLPRAVHFDGETMRVFQAAGISDELRATVRVNPGMRFVDPAGRLLLDWPRPQEIGSQGWHASYRLHQPDLETLLRTKLAERPGVTVLTGTEVTAIDVEGDRVLLGCKDRSSGAPMQVTARYVVGCDGAGSRVRQAMGTTMEDLGFEERWLVVDLILKRARDDLGDHSVQFCDPVRPMTYCRSPGTRRRWEIALLADETEDEVTQTARIWRFLAPWINSDDADLERSAVYTFRSAVARTWREGRLMIAGDAAHLTPPFMGQGMCAGIRDAANLAWKLALCVKGQAGDALLKSYQDERAPNVRSYIETAMRLGGLINTLDPEAALAAAEPGGAGSARMASIAPGLEPSDLGAVYGPPDHLTGMLFSQPVLANGARMDDHVGYAPVLILRKPMTASLTTLDAETHPNLGPLLDALETNAVLLRPDRHIAASARCDDDIARLAKLSFPA